MILLSLLIICTLKQLTANAKGLVSGVVSFFNATLYNPTLNRASPNGEKKNNAGYNAAVVLPKANNDRPTIATLKATIDTLRTPNISTNIDPIRPKMMSTIPFTPKSVPAFESPIPYRGKKHFVNMSITL